MKPLGVQWMLNVYMTSRSDIIKIGFHKYGVKDDCMNVSNCNFVLFKVLLCRIKLQDVHTI